MNGFPLTTLNLDILAFTNQHLQNRYLGAFACDTLPHPSTVKPGYGLIVNSDPAGTWGTHWLGIYLNTRGQCEFFNSFGLGPTNRYIINFLNYFSKPFIYNNVCLQSFDAQTCGMYVIYFLFKRTRGESFKKIITSLQKSCKSNDDIVKKLTKIIK